MAAASVAGVASRALLAVLVVLYGGQSVVARIVAPPRPLVLPSSSSSSSFSDFHIGSATVGDEPSSDSKFTTEYFYGLGFIGGIGIFFAVLSLILLISFCCFRFCQSCCCCKCCRECTEKVGSRSHPRSLARLPFTDSFSSTSRRRGSSYSVVFLNRITTANIVYVAVWRSCSCSGSLFSPPLR